MVLISSRSQSSAVPVIMPEASVRPYRFMKRACGIKTLKRSNAAGSTLVPPLQTMRIRRKPASLGPACINSLAIIVGTANRIVGGRCSIIRNMASALNTCTSSQAPPDSIMGSRLQLRAPT
ncbi:hypothetical protein D3C86_1518450 [compost metagenome]